jgi:hypothetical protein
MAFHPYPQRESGLASIFEINIAICDYGQPFAFFHLSVVRLLVHGV